MSFPKKTCKVLQVRTQSAPGAPQAVVLESILPRSLYTDEKVSRPIEQSSIGDPLLNGDFLLWPFCKPFFNDSCHLNTREKLFPKGNKFNVTDFHVSWIANIVSFILFASRMFGFAFSTRVLKDNTLWNRNRDYQTLLRRDRSVRFINQNGFKDYSSHTTLFEVATSPSKTCHGLWYLVRSCKAFLGTHSRTRLPDCLKSQAVGHLITSHWWYQNYRGARKHLQWLCEQSNTLSIAQIARKWASWLQAEENVTGLLPFPRLL